MLEETPAAEALPTPVETVIIGAGPVGLFQIFELGLLGISTHIIDSLAQAGGQCTELYPDKPIYDIPALPICGAQELVDRLLEAGVRVLALHPNQVKATRDRFRASGGKSDHFDRFVLCELARTDRHRFRILAIHVEDGDLQHLGDVGCVNR